MRGSWTSTPLADPGDAVIVNKVIDHIFKRDEQLGFGDARLLKHFEGHAHRVMETTVNTVSTFAGVSVNIPDHAARAIVARGGTHLLGMDIEGQTRKALFKGLAESRAAGYHPSSAATRRLIQRHVTAGRFTKMVDRYGKPYGHIYRAKLIARTETMYAQNESALATYEASDAVVQGEIIDNQTGYGDADCIARNGFIGPLTECRRHIAEEHPQGTARVLPVLKAVVAPPKPPPTPPAAPSIPRPPIPRPPLPRAAAADDVVAARPAARPAATSGGVDEIVASRRLPAHNQERLSTFADDLRTAAPRADARTGAELRKIADELPAYRTTAARDSGVEDLRAALRETFSEDNVSQYMAIRTPNLKKAINDNSLKSSIQTGKGTHKTVAEQRFRQVEQRVFNLADEALTDHDLMPKYGFIADKRKIDAAGILDNSYGSTYVRFKPQVRRRSTITNADSFDGNRPGTSFNPGTPLNEVGDEVFVPYQVRQSRPPLPGVSEQHAADQLAKWGKTKKYDDLQRAVGPGPYTETQIYGKTTLDDVAEILVSTKSDQKTLRTLLKKKGHDIPVVPSGHHDRLYKISKGFRDDMTSFTPADIDRLGASYIDKILDANGLRSPNWNTTRLPDSIVPLRNRVIEGRAAGSLTIDDKRAYLREFFRLAGQKQDGGLPKPFWKDFRQTKAGFTDDVNRPGFSGDSVH